MYRANDNFRLIAVKNSTAGHSYRPNNTTVENQIYLELLFYLKDASRGLVVFMSQTQLPDADKWKLIFKKIQQIASGKKKKIKFRIEELDSTTSAIYFSAERNEEILNFRISEIEDGSNGVPTGAVRKIDLKLSSFEQIVLYQIDSRMLGDLDSVHCDIESFMKYELNRNFKVSMLLLSDEDHTRLMENSKSVLNALHLKDEHIRYFNEQFFTVDTDSYSTLDLPLNIYKLLPNGDGAEPKEAAISFNKFSTATYLENFTSSLNIIAADLALSGNDTRSSSSENGTDDDDSLARQYELVFNS